MRDDLLSSGAEAESDRIIITYRAEARRPGHVDQTEIGVTARHGQHLAVSHAAVVGTRSVESDLRQRGLGHIKDELRLDDIVRQQVLDAFHQAEDVEVPVHHLQAPGAELGVVRSILALLDDANDRRTERIGQTDDRQAVARAGGKEQVARHGQRPGRGVEGQGQRVENIAILGVPVRVSVGRAVLSVVDQDQPLVLVGRAGHAQLRRPGRYVEVALGQGHAVRDELGRQVVVPQPVHGRGVGQAVALVVHQRDPARRGLVPELGVSGSGPRIRGVRLRIGHVPAAEHVDKSQIGVDQHVRDSARRQLARIRNVGFGGLDKDVPLDLLVDLQFAVEQGVGQLVAVPVLVKDLHVHEAAVGTAEVRRPPAHALGAVEREIVVVDRVFDIAVRVAALPGAHGNPVVEAVAHDLDLLALAGLGDADHRRGEEGDVEDIHVGEPAQHHVREAVLVHHLDRGRPRVVGQGVGVDAVEGLHPFSAGRRQDLVDLQELPADVQLRIAAEIGPVDHHRGVAGDGAEGRIDTGDIRAGRVAGGGSVEVEGVVRAHGRARGIAQTRLDGDVVLGIGLELELALAYQLDEAGRRQAVALGKADLEQVGGRILAHLGMHDVDPQVAGQIGVQRQGVRELDLDAVERGGDVFLLPRRAVREHGDGGQGDLADAPAAGGDLQPAARHQQPAGRVVLVARLAVDHRRDGGVEARVVRIAEVDDLDHRLRRLVLLVGVQDGDIGLATRDVDVVHAVLVEVGPGRQQRDGADHDRVVGIG